MKGFIPLACVVISLFLVLQPAAAATACNRTIAPTLTLWQPGPDGSIYVESSPPGAIISVNGENHGHAPVTVSGLWPGTYTVTASMAGYEEYTTTTTISGPTRSPVYCSLVPLTSSGALSITSVPSGARVYLDGEYRGYTPAVLARSAGITHRIRLELDGYEDWNSSIDNNEGGIHTITAILVPGSSGLSKGISISSSPAGATVMLDGVAKGTTPITVKNLVPGIHILELNLTGYSLWKSTIDAPDNGIKTIEISLAPKTAGSPGTIMVYSRPGNATVSLDGKMVGMTPENGSLDLGAVSAGEHWVSLECAGYKSYFARSMVSSGAVSEINGILVPEKGVLSVSSVPSGAEIIIDNRSRGYSPLIASDLTQGDHQITFRMEGYRDHNASVAVFAGNTSVLSVTLIPVSPALHSPALPITAIIALFLTAFITLRKRE